jgi:hypothetical protein
VFLIDDLIVASLKGTIWVIEQVYDQAQKELNDEGTVRKQLVALRLEYEMGEVDQEAYADREAELTARLREIRLARLAALRGDEDGTADPG